MLFGEWIHGAWNVRFVGISYFSDFFFSDGKIRCRRCHVDLELVRFFKKNCVLSFDEVSEIGLVQT